MKISEPEVRQALETGFMILLDHEYYLPTEEEFKTLIPAWLEYLETVLKPMLVERKASGKLKKEPDCDNYAWWFVGWVMLEGYAIGLGVIKGHALIVWIDDKKQRRWFEPQTGQILTEQPERLKVTVMP